ncbi:MAG: LamG domain-containing protein [Myxococcales bacterium]|nr:LamG domain-containing protein [Myxococcales bacterium]
MKLSKYASLVAVLGCAFGYGVVACGGASSTDDDEDTGGGGNGGSKSGGKGGSSPEGGKGGSSTEGGKGGSSTEGGKGGGSAGKGGTSGGTGGASGGKGGSPGTTGGSGGSGNPGTGNCPSTSGGLNVTGGLIGHWKFDGDTKDSSSNMNNGTFVRGTVADAPSATATFTCGKRGQALFLDNPNSSNPYWVRVPSSVSINSIQDTFTITLWARVDGFDPSGEDWNFLVSRHQSGTSVERFGFGVVNGQLAASVTLQGATSPDVVPKDEKFHHLAVTYDSALGDKVYIDGQESDASGALFSIAQDTTNLIIGANQNIDLVKEGWHGAIDDVKLYSVVLTPEQIATDAQ